MCNIPALVSCVLDSAMANKFWLADQAQRLGSKASLFGTDIAHYETDSKLHPNVTLSHLNIKDAQRTD